MATRNGRARRRRWPWLALGVLALLAATYLLRASLVAPWLTARLASKLRAEQGLELSVGRVGGDWLSSLTLADVRVEQLDGSLLLAVRECAVRFSLLGLATDGLAGVEQVSVSGLDLRYDPERRAAREPSAREPVAFAWPERWPALRLEDARVALSLGGERSLELEGVVLESSDGERWVARAARAAFASPETRWPAAACALAGRFAAGRLELSQLELDGRSVLRRGLLDLREIAARKLAWDVALTPAFGELASSGSLVADQLAAGLTLANGEGSALRALFPPLARQVWSGTLDAEARIDARLVAGGELEIAVRAAARDGDVLGQRFERLATELVVTRTGVALSRLDVRRGADRVVAHDLIVPFDLDAGGIRGRIELDTADVPGLVGKPELGADVPTHQVHLAATVTGTGVVIDGGRVTTASGVLELDAGKVTLGATRERWLADAQVELSGRADFADLSELGGALGREGWCGSARGRFELRGGLESPEGLLDLEGGNVEIEGRSFGDVQVSARVDRELVRVSRAMARGAWGELELAGELNHRTRRLAGVSVDARLVLPVPWVPPFARAGEVEVSARLDGALDAPHAEFVLSARGVDLGASRIEGLDARGVWQGTSVRFDHLAARAFGLQVVATGELSSLDWRAPYLLVLESLHAEREGRSLDLITPVDLRLGEGSLDFDHAHLAGDAGRWIAACHVSRESLALELELVELSPLGLLDPFLPAGVDLDGLRGKLQLLREGERLTCAVDLTVERARLQPDGRQYSLVARGLYDDHRLALERLELAEGERRVLSLSGTAPLDPFGDSPFAPGELELQARLAIQHFEELPERLRPPGAEPRGQLEADLDLAGTWRAPRGRLALRACELELDGVGALAGRRIGPCEIDLELEFDERVRLRRCSIVDPGRARAELAGEVDFAPRVLDWLESGPPLAADVGLDLVASAAIDDLSFLRRIVPELGRVGGRAAAELAIGASLAAPTWSGGLRIADGELRFESDLPKLANLAAEIEFRGYVARVRSLSGTLGSGPFQASGTVELSKPEPHFDLRLDGQEILLARAEDLRLRADAKLSVVGPPGRLRIGGELNLRDGRYTKNFELLDRFSGRSPSSRPTTRRGFVLPSIARGPFAQAEFAVEVRAAESLRVYNNVLRASLRPSLRLRGTGAAPLLSGSIFLESARINLPTSTLRIDSGTITLPEQVPIVPTLKLRGETRVAGYDVAVSLDGPYDDPIVFSSTPPLSQAELVVLLLTGQPPADSFAANSGRAAQTFAVYLGQDVIARWFGDEEGESLVERFEWQQGREMTESGGQTMQVSLRLTADEDEARRVIYLRGEKDVYDRVNFGVKFLFRLR